MEHLLSLYALPYDAQHPVICFDERSCFLIGDQLAPLLMQSGQVRKEHYAYEKNGSCALLAAIEPLTGERLAQVKPNRTKKEYTEFCQALAARYPEAKKIRLVQDNLNTHNASSFYEHLPAEQAFALAERFEFNYKPKSASWLNMIEIEFSALSRQCLDRHIPTIEQLEKEVCRGAVGLVTTIRRIPTIEQLEKGGAGLSQRARGEEDQNQLAVLSQNQAQQALSTGQSG
jgi:hypothetical protein